MNASKKPKRIGVIGSGPSALFILKTLLDTTRDHLIVDIYEAGTETGSGFPYSAAGSCYEHITNVSGNEIPKLVTSTTEWMNTVPAATLQKYEIDLEHFNEYHVFPRLLFGEYLQAQFELLLKRAADEKITVHVHLNSRVTDIIDDHLNETLEIMVGTKKYNGFSQVIICSGHQWPATHEGKHPGYYDSPYPPVKLAKPFNHKVAIKGGALTAIDAIRTLARQNGRFVWNDKGQPSFEINEKSNDFGIVLYSLKGLLPGIRFHLEDSHLSVDSLLSEEEIQRHRDENDGFLSLDFVFEKDFKEPLQKKDPALYEIIQDMQLEEFVEAVMSRRERTEPFQLFRAEYEEAKQSIQRKQSVHWKEMLAVLSFAMNYPAKHFSAEDMQRLQKVLMPLISIIIAFVPQDSCEELLALHDAGRLAMVAVEKDSHVELKTTGGITYHHTDEDGNAHAISYQTFINATGQPHLSVKELPFSSLVENGNVVQALLPFRSSQKARQALQDNDKIIEKYKDQFFLEVPGLAITDSFNVIGRDNNENPRIYMMAVPFIGGYNPDYSGLDFCEEASRKIIGHIFSAGADADGNSSPGYD